ncbi:MAG: PH domain-containing protein [Xanthobacteraceae bacterium]|nr:PH domain-containing protein [Xanthobacteraceae bacterium]
MSYIEKTMEPGEEIVHRSRLHWIDYIVALEVLIIGVVVIALTILVPIPSSGSTARAIAIAVGVLLVAIAVIKFFGTWIARSTTEFGVTNYRVVAKRGLIRRDVTEIDIAKIEGVDFRQSVFGRLFGYGTVMFRGTGSGENVMSGIDDPLAFAQAVRREVRSYQQWAKGQAHSEVLSYSDN